GRSQAIGSPHLRPGCRQRQHVPRHVRNTYVSAWSPSDICGRTDFSHRRGSPAFPRPASGVSRLDTVRWWAWGDPATRPVSNTLAWSLFDMMGLAHETPDESFRP